MASPRVASGTATPRPVDTPSTPLLSPDDATRAMRRFLIGYAINGSFASLQQLIRGGLTASNLRRVLRKLLCTRTSIALGSMMAAYGLLYSVTRRLMLRGGSSALTTSAVAGAVAGTSIYSLTACTGTHLDPLELSLHALVRAIQAGVSQSAVAPLLHHVDAGIFIAACTIIMHAWFFHPSTLTRSYRTWISRMANMDARLLTALRHLRDGTMRYGVRTSHLDTYCDDNCIPRERGDVGNGFLHCSVVHPLDGGLCLGNSVRRFTRGFTSALSLYLPVHMIAQFLVQRKALATLPTSRVALAAWALRVVQYITRASGAAVRSSAFLGAFIALAWSGVCIARNAVQDDRPFGPLLGAFLSGWSIFIEHPKRRAELAAYVAPRALHCAGVHAIEAGLVKAVPGAHVTVFMLACALLMLAYERSRAEGAGGEAATTTLKDSRATPNPSEPSHSPPPPARILLPAGMSDSEEEEEDAELAAASRGVTVAPPTWTDTLRLLTRARNAHFPPTLGAIVELFTS